MSNNFFDDLIKQSSGDEPPKTEPPTIKDVFEKFQKDFDATTQNNIDSFFGQGAFGSILGDTTKKSTNRIPPEKSHGDQDPPEEKGDGGDGDKPEDNSGCVMAIALFLMAIGGLLALGLVLFLVKIVWKIAIW